MVSDTRIGSRMTAGLSSKSMRGTTVRLLFVAKSCHESDEKGKALLRFRRPILTASEQNGLEMLASHSETNHKGDASAN